MNIQHTYTGMIRYEGEGEDRERITCDADVTLVIDITKLNHKVYQMVQRNRKSGTVGFGAIKIVINETRETGRILVDAESPFADVRERARKRAEGIES